jgi:EAL domain-containing protein (putative c-di-GMP-specific phosphodiesterase class I)
VSLEITESAVMEDPAHALAILERLHAMGVGLAIDDFGTGYSSLAYLKRLPVDELKIDKSFVIGLERDPDDAAIVRATIDLAHHMGLTVTAEGVEDAAVLQTLRRLGCDRAQGHHVSPPLAPAELERWSRQGTTVRTEATEVLLH